MTPSSMNSICCILNFAPHYRSEIYLRMEQELGCDFYFGDKSKAKIKKIDYGLFQRPPQELRYVRLAGYFNWLMGSLRLCFQPYQFYILTGEPYCLSSWVVMLINRIRGRKSLVWTHGWYGKERGFKKLIKRAYFGLADEVLLYGNYAKNLMVKEGFRDEKLHVIYNSLAYRQQKIIRKQLKVNNVYFDHFGNTQPTLVFVGRLEPQKKLCQLLKALAKLTESKPNLCIIGDGRSRAHLEALVAKLGISSRVWFYGACYEEAVLAMLIYNSQICASPGEVGLTAIHALTYGTPVVTHSDFTNQMPEFEAIEHNKTGMFFQKDNIKDLASTIHYWLEKHPTKSQAMIQDCFLKIDQFYNPDYQIALLKKQLIAKTESY